MYIHTNRTEQNRIWENGRKERTFDVIKGRFFFSFLTSSAFGRVRREAKGKSERRRDERMRRG